MTFFRNITRNMMEELKEKNVFKKKSEKKESKIET